jgi:hypothetical protein
VAGHAHAPDQSAQIDQIDQMAQIDQIDQIDQMAHTSRAGNRLRIVASPAATSTARAKR